MNESCRREYSSLKSFALSSAKTMDTYLHNCWVAVVATYLYIPMCKRVTYKDMLNRDTVPQMTYTGVSLEKRWWSGKFSLNSNYNFFPGTSVPYEIVSLSNWE